MTAVESPPATIQPSVGLVVNTFEQAHFLSSALASGMAQTHPFDEIIVVDDGSTDHPEAVLASFPRARLIRQSNAGLAASRNAGLAAIATDFVIFLDADDLLLPNAVESGLACHALRPNCGLVYGGFRRINAEGEPIEGPKYTPIGPDPYATLLRCNAIGMHATVMYSREVLSELGGFDTSYPRCEDYEGYLRITRAHKVASHSNIVALYRWHGRNMSAEPRMMLKWVLRANDSQRTYTRDKPKLEAARREGRRIWRRYYATLLIQDVKREWRIQRRAIETGRRLVAAVSIAPLHTMREMIHTAFTRMRAARIRARGKINLGDLGTTVPISLDFGFDRGTPVDRLYIMDFLDRQRHRISGRVLEVGDASYSRLFGADRVTHHDVLFIDDSNPEATIVGDLTDPSVLPEDAFDCIILTQTLHLIFDVHQAARQLFKALRPGGALLLTVPGITPLERGKWGAMWCWSFTTVSAFKLFEAVFGPDNVQVEAHGNVLAATAFIQGLSMEELDKDKLQEYDPAYPIIVTVVARKPKAH